MTDNERLFLIGLEKLSRETGVKIEGDDTGTSPYLIEFDDEELHREAGYGESSDGEIRWISPMDQYDWINHADSIVKPTVN